MEIAAGTILAFRTGFYNRLRGPVFLVVRAFDQKTVIDDFRAVENTEYVSDEIEDFLNWLQAEGFIKPAPQAVIWGFDGEDVEMDDGIPAKPNEAAWFYGPNGEAEIFNSPLDAPEGWADSPARWAAEVAEKPAVEFLDQVHDPVPPVKRGPGRPRKETADGNGA